MPLLCAASSLLLPQILGRGFHSAPFQKKFDETISKLTTHWCCRSPKDQVRGLPEASNHCTGELVYFQCEPTLSQTFVQERYNATDLAVLRILPVDRDPSALVFKAVYGIERSMGGYNNSY